MDLGIQGKRAFVAGSSSGIGRSVAELFAREGVRLFLLARNEERLERAAGDIRATGGDVSYFAADLASAGGVDSALDAAVSAMGGIDILINNAGGPRPGSFDALSDDDWERAFHLTLMSAVRMTRRALPGMIERGWGRIVNITSTSVRQPIEGLMLSNSIRMAVIGFAKTLTMEASAYGITVNSVAPGYTSTERLRDIAEARALADGTTVDEMYRRWAADTPLGRLGTPEEVAAAVVFLASVPGGYINGAVIPVDGGRIRGN